MKQSEIVERCGEHHGKDADDVSPKQHVHDTFHVQSPLSNEQRMPRHQRPLLVSEEGTELAAFNHGKGKAQAVG